MVTAGYFVRYLVSQDAKGSHGIALRAKSYQAILSVNLQFFSKKVA